MPDDTIQQIKARIAVEELAREAGLQLRQEGGEFKSPCPFHKDTDPSFTIYQAEDGQRYKCFGCKKGGDVIDFYQEWRKVDRATALKELAARIGAEPAGAADRRPTPPRPQRREKPDDGLAGYPPAKPKEESTVALPGGLVPVSLADGVLERQSATLHRHPSVLQFLQEKRRLTPEIIQRAKLGYDEKRERIIIPMTGPDGTVVRSRLYDWQKRQKGAKVIWGQGETIPRLYPFWALEHDELLLVAGEMDCLAAWSLGIPAITGTGGEEKWGRAYSKPLAGKKITICYDLDPQGQNGARLVAEDLVKVASEVKIMTLPLPWKEKGDPKDLTDWILAGGTAEQLRELIARATVLPKPVQPDEEDEPQPVLDRLPGAPVSDQAMFPARWLVTEKGVFEKTSQNGRTQYRPVVSVPVVVTERIRNLDTDLESLKIAFQRDGHWRMITAERDTVADKGRLVRLSARGLPVTSNTSGRLVQYLADYEAANLDVIPVQTVVSISGWRLEDEPLFLSGTGLIRAAGEEKGTSLVFQPETDGDGQLVASLRARGDVEAWKGMVRRLLPFHRLMFCLYASAATPLLSPCEAPNFIVDLAGDTSRGKTTALEVAASVWGMPPGHVGGLVKSWNVTKVFAERYSALFNDHPVFLDDSQTTDQRTVAGVLYMVANGIGRGRGAAKGGVQRVTHWRTVCFSTGEQPLTSNTEFGGARARVLTLWGSPFNSDNQGDLVRDVKAVCASHYGFLGRMVVEKLIEIHREGWDGLREIYQTRVQQLARQFPGNVADRLSRYVGLVWAAADLVHHVLGLETSPEPVIMRIMKEVTSELEEGDYATRAMDAVRSWAQASVNQFYGKEEHGRPPAQYIGIWRYVSGDSHLIGFFPTRLKDFLIVQGYSYDAVMRQWRDRGWIRVQSGKSTCTVRIYGDVQRMILIPWDIWQEGWDTVTPE